MMTAALPMDDRRRRQRQRAKNWALLIVLFALAALFYLITLVRFGSWQ